MLNRETDKELIAIATNLVGSYQPSVDLLPEPWHNHPILDHSAASEMALTDWNRPEEDQAWAYLQKK